MKKAAPVSAISLCFMLLSVPEFYLFGGPNGAGKTTTALQILPALDCRRFVNADIIAQALTPLEPDAANLKAGVMLMRQVRELAQSGVDFGTETTLAARTYVPLVNRWRALGYRFHLFYVWLPSADMAVARVASRVRAGGHNIPEDVIRRRYQAGRANFCEYYKPNADFWTVLDNSQPNFRVIAKGDQNCEEIFDPKVWNAIHQSPNEP